MDSRRRGSVCFLVRPGVDERRGQQVDGLREVKRRSRRSWRVVAPASERIVHGGDRRPAGRPPIAASRLEVGWAMLSSFRKRGMATEVGRAVLSFATDELRASRVIAFTERHNLASRRVVEKLGLSLSGEIRTRGLVEGQDEEQNDAPFVGYHTGNLTWRGQARGLLGCPV